MTQSTSISQKTTALYKRYTGKIHAKCVRAATWLQVPRAIGEAQWWAPRGRPGNRRRSPERLLQAAPFSQVGRAVSFRSTKQHFPPMNAEAREGPAVFYKTRQQLDLLMCQTVLSSHLLKKLWGYLHKLACSWCIFLKTSFSFIFKFQYSNLESLIIFKC